MTVDEMAALFEKHNEEFVRFERISVPRHPRPDLHAFLLLHELDPNSCHMVAAAEHDEIYLEVDPERVATKITEDQVLELVRCGVRFGDTCFCMFV